MSATRVGISNVGRELSGGEGLACGVLPGAAEGIACSDEFEGSAGGEAGQPTTVSEHFTHVIHFFAYSAGLNPDSLDRSNRRTWIPCSLLSVYPAELNPG